MREDCRTSKKRRPKGDGNIQQLSRDKFKIMITIGYDAQGKQRRKTFTGKTQKEVIDKKNQYLADKQQGTLVVTNNCKMSDYIDRWLALKQSQTKIRTYESYMDTCRLHIKPAIGVYKVQKLTTICLNDYLAGKLQAGLSAGTVKRHKAIIHGILDMAVREGIIARNAVDYCNPILVRQKETKVISDNEKDKLLKIARDIYEKDKNKENRFYLGYHFILLALATGARRGEIVGLKWDSVDFERHIITIRDNIVEVKGGIKRETPKTKNSVRSIGVAGNVMQKLLELKSDSEWVFHTRTGNPLTPSNVSREYRKLLKIAGIKGLRFHDLRHSHATQGLANGVDIKTMSRRLGHSDPATTIRIYAHTSDIQDQEAGEKIGSWLLN